MTQPRSTLRHAILSLLVTPLLGCGASAGAPIVEGPRPVPATTPAVALEPAAAPPAVTPEASVPVVAPAPEEPTAVRQARARQTLSVPLPPGPLPTPRTCVVQLYRPGQDEETGAAEWWEAGDTLDRFDRAHRRVLHRWNSNQVALSGEVRYFYRRDGSPSRTEIENFESITREPPPRLPPLIHSVAREGDETVITSRRRGVIGRVERVLVDGEGRVLRRSVADAWEESGDPLARDLELPRPSVIECHYDERGRVTSVGRDQFLYEEDVLIAIERGWLDTPDVRWIFATASGFLVVDDAEDGAVDRYTGDCAAVFFEPCAAAWSPRAEAPTALVTLGAPL